MDQHYKKAYKKYKLKYKLKYKQLLASRSATIRGGAAEAAQATQNVSHVVREIIPDVNIRDVISDEIEEVFQKCICGTLLSYKAFRENKADYSLKAIKILYIQSLVKQIEKHYTRHFQAGITKENLNTYWLNFMSTQQDFHYLFYIADQLKSEFIDEHDSSPNNRLICIGESPNRIVCAMECIVPDNYSIDYIPLSGLSEFTEIFPEFNGIFETTPDVIKIKENIKDILPKILEDILTQGNDFNFSYPNITDYFKTHGLDFSSVIMRKGYTYIIDVMSTGRTLMSLIVLLYYTLRELTPEQRTVYINQIRFRLYHKSNVEELWNYSNQNIFPTLLEKLFGISNDRYTELLMSHRLPLTNISPNIIAFRNNLFSSSVGDVLRMDTLIKLNFKITNVAEFPDENYTNARCIRSMKLSQLPIHGENPNVHNKEFDASTGKAYLYCNVTRALIFHLYEIWQKKNYSDYSYLPQQNTEFIKFYTANYIPASKAMFETKKQTKKNLETRAEAAKTLYLRFINDFSDSVKFVS